MPIRQILSLKRAAIQTHIDALTSKIARADQKLVALRAQGDGLTLGDAGAGFQLAAMADRTSRALVLKLERERGDLMRQREAFAREKLSLDIADRKLADEAQRQVRLDLSRADDRA